MGPLHCVLYILRVVVGAAVNNEILYAASDEELSMQERSKITCAEELVRATIESGSECLMRCPICSE